MDVLLASYQLIRTLMWKLLLLLLFLIRLISSKDVRVVNYWLHFETPTNGKCCALIINNTPQQTRLQTQLSQHDMKSCRIDWGAQVKRYCKINFWGKWAVHIKTREAKRGNLAELYFLNNTAALMEVTNWWCVFVVFFFTSPNIHLTIWHAFFICSLTKIETNMLSNPSYTKWYEWHEVKCCCHWDCVIQFWKW